MTQQVRFEYASESVVVPAGVLASIQQITSASPDQDIRVTDDGNNNVKVYVGTPYSEKYRHWLYIDGRVLLVEEDTSDDGLDGIWVPISEEAPDGGE